MVKICVIVADKISEAIFSLVMYSHTNTLLRAKNFIEVKKNYKYFYINSSLLKYDFYDFLTKHFNPKL